jgi:Lrp/AsnC family leucine-responsive transcriptional regulator
MNPAAASPKTAAPSPLSTSPAPPAQTAAHALDGIDMQILRLLQDDARLPNLKLAQAVGLSPAAVHERVRRLVREGYILGYEAVLNPALLGGGLLVFVEVQLDAMGAGLHAAFKSAVHQQPQILECHEVAGDFDYLLKTRVPDLAAYRDLVARVVWRLPGVRGMRSHAVMEEVKCTGKIAV